jgi:hypothetical protein
MLPRVFSRSPHAPQSAPGVWSHLFLMRDFSHMLSFAPMIALSLSLCFFISYSELRHNAAPGFDGENEIGSPVTVTAPGSAVDTLAHPLRAWCEETRISACHRLHTARPGRP